MKFIIQLLELLLVKFLSVRVVQLYEITCQRKWYLVYHLCQRF